MVTRTPRWLSRPCTSAFTLRARSTSAKRTCPCSSRSTSCSPASSAGSSLSMRPFGQHGHAEVPSHGLPLDDRPFDDVADGGEGDVAGGELLGDHGQRRAGRLADAERQVSRLASHGHHHVPAPGGPRVLHEVAHQLDARVAGGLEAEGRHVRRQGQVVVDRLRDVHAADGALRVLADGARRERGVVAADRHQVRDARLLQRLDHRARGLRRLGRVLARGAEHGAAQEVHRARRRRW